LIFLGRWLDRKYLYYVPFFIMKKYFLFVLFFSLFLWYSFAWLADYYVYDRLKISNYRYIDPENTENEQTSFCYKDKCVLYLTKSKVLETWTNVRLLDSSEYNLFNVKIDWTKLSTKTVLSTWQSL